MTLADLKRANKAAGHHFFDRDTLARVDALVLGEVFEGPGGVFFITSEKPPVAYCRRFCVWRFESESGRVYQARDAESFALYATHALAREAAKEHARLEGRASLPADRCACAGPVRDPVGGVLCQRCLGTIDAKEPTDGDEDRTEET